MANNILLLSVVAVPVVGAFILPILGRFSEKIRNFFAFLFVFIPLVCSFKLAGLVISGGSVSFSKILPLGFNFILTADGLAVFMAIVSLAVGLIIVLFSFDYISHYENRNEYYLMVVLFLGSMMGIVFSANLIYLYLFWEMTAIVSWRLIGFFRGKTDVIRADKALLITVFGALVMLIGFLSLYQQTGSFDLAVIKEALKTQPLTQITALLILAGILSKSATLPFHTWLPDAGVAPSPVTALLHAAVLVKIGVYVFARLFIATFLFTPSLQTIVLTIAAASALISAGAALIDTDLKRIIAYSTVSQIAFIFFGLASGTVIGVVGGLLYILMHGIAKAGLFLCAGIIEQNTKTKDITKMGGLIQTMPWTAMAFFFCAASVMGIPPFGGFFSKYLVFMGAIADRQWIFVSLFLLGAFMTVLYLFRAFRLIFLGEQKVKGNEGSPVMVACVVFLAVLSLAGGIFISYPAFFAKVAIIPFAGVLK